MSISKIPKITGFKTAKIILDNFFPDTLAAINSPESEIAPIQMIVETIALSGKISKTASTEVKAKKSRILLNE